MNEEAIGTFRSPSGNLVIVDFGLMGGWSKKVASSVSKLLQRGGGVSSALELGNVVALPNLPSSELRVVGVRNGGKRWSKLWKHIDLKVSDATVASTEDLGEVLVERARLMFADAAVLGDWEHEDTLDGLADIAFWGSDAELLAKASGAKKLGDVWGFADMPLDAAKAKYAELAELVETNDWFVRAEPREHDHHYHLLKAAQSSPNGAGMLELSGATHFGLFVEYGDGAFPVQRCLDANGALAAVRVVLGTEDALDALDAVNG